jgi:hypothetical protein
MPSVTSDTAPFHCTVCGSNAEPVVVIDWARTAWPASLLLWMPLLLMLALVSLQTAAIGLVGHILVRVGWSVEVLVCGGCGSVLSVDGAKALTVRRWKRLTQDSKLG